MSTALAEIERIDARSRTVRMELAPLAETHARARRSASAAAPEDASAIVAASVELERLTADLWLNPDPKPIDRERVNAAKWKLDAAESAARDLKAKARAAAQEAATAADAIAQRMAPLETELVELANRRGVAERRFLREEGQAAGRAYRKAIEALGETWAAFREVSNVLAERESRVTAGRLSYGMSDVSYIEGLPTIGSGVIEAFKNCAYPSVSIEVRNDDSRPPIATTPGNVIVSASVAAAVRHRLLEAITPKT